MFLTEILFRNSKQAIEIDVGKERKKAIKSKQKTNIAEKHLKNLISNRSWLSRRDVMSSHGRKIHQWEIIIFEFTALLLKSRSTDFLTPKIFLELICVVGVFSGMRIFWPNFQFQFLPPIETGHHGCKSS